MKKVKARSISGIEYEFSAFRCEFAQDSQSNDIIYSLIGIDYVDHFPYNVVLLTSSIPQDILREYDCLKHQLDVLSDDSTIDYETKQIFHNHLLEI